MIEDVDEAIEAIKGLIDKETVEAAEAIISRAEAEVGGWDPDPEFNRARNLMALFEVLFTQVKNDAGRIANLQRKLGQYVERLP